MCASSKTSCQRGWATASALDANVIEPRHLFGEASSAATSTPSQELSYHDALRGFQIGFLQGALEECDWNVSEAARRLELSRSRLNELIRSLGIQRPTK